MRHLPRTPEAIGDFVSDLMARNRALYGGYFMGPDDGQDDDSDDSDDDGQDDADDSDDGDDDDSDDGEPDYKARFEAQQRINRKLERRTRKDAQRLKDLEGKGGKKSADDGKGKDDQPDAETIRAEAREEAAREALQGRVEDKIEAKARAFADPEDAMAVLLRSHDIDDFIDDGKVDVEAITDALGELAEKKPHLLAQGGKKFQGDGDGGTRKETKGRPKTLGDAVARHYQ